MIDVDTLLAEQGNYQEQRSQQHLQELQEKQQRELQSEQQSEHVRVEVAKKSAEYLASLLREGNTKLEEALDPALLGVQTQQEAVHYAIEALHILHTEKTFDPGFTLLSYKEDDLRQDYTHKQIPLKILTHMEWAKTREVEQEHRDLDIYTDALLADITPEGAAIAEKFAVHMGYQSPQETLAALATIQQELADEERAAGER